MAKIYKIVDPRQPSISSDSNQTDRSLCILCQEYTSEVLHCPVESKCTSDGTGHKPYHPIEGSVRNKSPFRVIR